MKDAKQIIRELVEEVMNEMTATGAVGGYLTPRAFRGHKSKKKSAERSMPGGKVVGKEDTDNTTVGEGEEVLVRRDIVEARSRYRNFKESDMMRNEAKINLAVQEAKKMLGEVEYLLDISERLKSECGFSNDNLYKRTVPNIIKINERLKSIARRLERLRKQ
jgi:hypothetical protein